MSSNNNNNRSSQSQSQSINNGGSSPLFFPSSSNPPSDIGTPAAAPPAPRSHVSSSHGGSSPLHYSSSLYNSDTRGGNGGGITSDVRSDLTSDAARERFRRNNYQRGDLNSPDSSLPRRRYFADSPLNSRNTISSNGLNSDMTETGNDEPVRVIWGTNVSIQECSNNFRNFIMLFK